MLVFNMEKPEYAWQPIDMATRGYQLMATFHGRNMLFSADPCRGSTTGVRQRGGVTPEQRHAGLSLHRTMCKKKGVRQGLDRG